MEGKDISKTIIVVVNDSNIESLLRRENVDFLSRLAMEGHQIVASYNNYIDAYEDIKSGKIYADMLILDRPNGEQSSNEQCMALLQEFDKIPSEPIDSDYFYDTAKIVVALGHMGIDFPDARFRADRVDKENSKNLEQTVDNMLRTSMRRTDMQIDPYELQDKLYYSNKLDAINKVARGHYQAEKSEALTNRIEQERIRAEHNTDQINR